MSVWFVETKSVIFTLETTDIICNFIVYFYLFLRPTKSTQCRLTTPQGKRPTSLVVYKYIIWLLYFYILWPFIHDSWVKYNLTFCSPKGLWKVNILTFVGFLRWVVINLCFFLDLYFTFSSFRFIEACKNIVAIMYN